MFRLRQGFCGQVLRAEGSLILHSRNRTPDCSGSVAVFQADAGGAEVDGDDDAYFRDW